MFSSNHNFRNYLEEYPSDALSFVSNVFSFQQKAYQDFILGNSSDSLSKVISDIFPIKCLFGNFIINYISLNVVNPINSESECIRMGLTYSSDVFVRLRMEFFTDQPDGSKILSGISEQDVLLFTIPMMTKDGKFILNGIERVVVSQIHRSPGLFFTLDKVESNVLYSASIIPYTGTWIDFSMHNSDYIEVIVDKRKKIDISTFLFAIGLSKERIVSSFYNKVECKIIDAKKGIVNLDINFQNLSLERSKFDLYNTKNEIIVPIGSILTNKKINEIKENGFNCKLSDIQNYLYSYDELSEFEIQSGSKISDELASKILESSKSLNLVDFTGKDFFDIILKSISSNQNIDKVASATNMLKILRKGENMDLKDPINLVRSFFFDSAKCNISNVGRYKINTILNSDETSLSLTEDDIFKILKRLILIKENSMDIEDIDHLGNRRIRLTSELIANVIKSNVSKLTKSAIDKMSTVGSGVSISPAELLTPNQMSKFIKDFFLTSQLSQLMEQTNPLAELGHKRRISALGAGGVERDRVGLEVRDVHFTHYGRICIVETPDSQNIGLINNLSCFAKINNHGFIETPYRVVKNRIVTDEIIYLDATKEMSYAILSYNLSYLKDKKITDDIVSVRKNGDFINIHANLADLMDIAPNQALSAIASLIPFLENNDAYRVLMGSNMQRQAVPLIKPEAPLVGTGFEGFIGLKSSAVITSRCEGFVRYLDSNKIFISNKNTSDLEVYNLKKFERTNQSTCVNFKPCIKVGDEIKEGQVVADGYASCLDEIAIGKNIKIAFMSWNGYGYEDSVVVSDKFVSEDNFTSIHIEEFETSVIDTRLGSEEITKDIPGLTDFAIRNLDESGIVKLGTFVKAGDILVGKLTPKAETPITPEEKLLRAIFDEKISDVKDVSLMVPPGYSGVVVDVDILSRRGIDKLNRQIEIESQKIFHLNNSFDAKIKIIKDEIFKEITNFISGEKIAKNCKLNLIPISREINEEWFTKLTTSEIFKIKFDNSNINSKFEEVVKKYNEIIKKIDAEHKVLASKIKEEKDFIGGTLYVVKVRVAMKNMLQPGDKVAGRYGNKGIISKVVPIMDMPFTENGEHIDMIINPLGIVARMNFGQVLELGLGLASITLGEKIRKVVSNYNDIKEVRDILESTIQDKNIRQSLSKLEDKEILSLGKAYSKGIPFAVPVFSGVSYECVSKILQHSGCDESGQAYLFDGRTGERFDRKISIGSMYILKLHHLVDRKVHARSVGPYSLITQQPLGGKAKFGGQRLGEMECWALEAYGAAYTLNEMLTVKSDDIDGRKRIYSSIVKGSTDFKHGIPESFNVLMKELSSLGLNVSLQE